MAVPARRPFRRVKGRSDVALTARSRQIHRAGDKTIAISSKTPALTPAYRGRWRYVPGAMSDDFASLFGSKTPDPHKAATRLTKGAIVEGTVVHIGATSLFLDIGQPTDARLDNHEFSDSNRRLPKVGDTVRATVVSFDPGDVPVLSLAIGRGVVNAAALEAAQAGDIPVEGTVTKAVKAGLEVEIGGVRAFCPASQVERSFTAELEPYVGQTMQFRVMEVRDDGRSVIVSRRALLEAEMAVQASERLGQLEIGCDVEGVVQSVHKFGAIVDVGGIEGMVHISELAPGRVERVEDVVNVDDNVTVRVVAIEETEKGPRVRLSLKALLAPPKRDKAGRDEVLKAKVTRTSSFGVFVETKRGDGLVSSRDLVLPVGSDHRRAYPVGKEFEVVLVNLDKNTGKMRFSMTGVDQVRERQNFQEYSGSGTTKTKTAGMGSLGDLMRKKLGLPEPEPAPEPEEPTPVAAQTAPAEVQSKAPVAAARPVARPPEAAATPAPVAAKPPAPAPRREPAQDQRGVVRRKKKD